MTRVTRREALSAAGKAAVVTVAAGSVVDLMFGDGVALARAGQVSPGAPLNAVAGVDRVVMTHGKTYLNAWAGYGAPPRPGRSGGGRGQSAVPAPTGPAPTVTWSKASGPGDVAFAGANAAVTTATFSMPGTYVLQIEADNGSEKTVSALTVKVEEPPPATQLTPVVTTRHAITSPLWKARTKTLITEWIPHCVAQIERTDLVQGPNSGAGGIDNFIEAAKALRGEPHGPHKGYVFSNAWVHQTVEAMSLALMVDPQDDADIAGAQAAMRKTLDTWIPIILSAQHPDGYLQTAFTLRDVQPEGGVPAASRGPWTDRWTPANRGNHEGYVGGYFIESAINHYQMTQGRDLRLYNAAKRLADCWADHIGPAPKQEWFDGHQEMEQALVRFGRFVNEIEGAAAKRAGKPAPGDRYIALAKFLLDCRKGGSEYDQSHLPVVQQYEAVGHAVRAVYTYSGMADVAVETHDVDYQSAVKSLWDNIVHRKYYVTGGVASGESSEGFGPNYSLRNNSYCEACSSCGEIFFQWKMHLAYHDAKYADLYEQTLYNALNGSLALDGTRFYYTNPLDANAQRTTWHSCPCCVGNLSRTMLMLPTWMYSKGTASNGTPLIYTNLFVGSDVTIPGVAGTDVQLVQATNYPWDGKVRITVNPSKPARFAILLREPNRAVSELYRSVPREKGFLPGDVRVNGQAVRSSVVNGYFATERTWKSGDTIEFTIDMPVQRVYASEKIAADKSRVALRVGPLVYNIEAVDQDIHKTLDPNTALAVEWRGDLLKGVNVVVGKFSDGSPMMAVPNFARYNRNPIPPPSPVPTTVALPAAPASPAPRPAPPPATSIVWISESN